MIVLLQTSDIISARPICNVGIWRYPCKPWIGSLYHLILLETPENISPLLVRRVALYKRSHGRHVVNKENYSAALEVWVPVRPGQHHCIKLYQSYDMLLAVHPTLHQGAVQCTSKVLFHRLANDDTTHRSNIASISTWFTRSICENKYSVLGIIKVQGPRRVAAQTILQKFELLDCCLVQPPLLTPVVFQRSQLCQCNLADSPNHLMLSKLKTTKQLWHFWTFSNTSSDYRIYILGQGFYSWLFITYQDGSLWGHRGVQGNSQKVADL